MKSELSDNFEEQEDFRLVGVAIHELLISGEDISDELYVQLFIAKLRMTYPFKTKAELTEEIREKVLAENNLKAKIRELEQELAGELPPITAEGKKRKKRSPEVVKAQLSETQDQLEDLQKVEKNGWVMVDFPCNMAQAKLLEKYLSGYEHPKECGLVRRGELLDEAAVLVKPTDRDLPPRELIPSGIDAAIWINTSR